MFKSLLGLLALLVVVACALTALHLFDRLHIAMAVLAAVFLVLALLLIRPALRRMLVLGLAIMAAVPLAGCANLPGSGNIGSDVLKNLQGCERHYQGALGVGVSGSFRIDCPAASPAGTVLQIPVAAVPAAAVTVAPAVAPPIPVTATP